MAVQTQDACSSATQPTSNHAGSLARKCLNIIGVTPRLAAVAEVLGVVALETPTRVKWQDLVVWSQAHKNNNNLNIPPNKRQRGRNLRRSTGTQDRPNPLSSKGAGKPGEGDDQMIQACG